MLHNLRILVVKNFIDDSIPMLRGVEVKGHVPVAIIVASPSTQLDASVEEVAPGVAAAVSGI